MFCRKCGANIANTSKFCGYCGEPTNIVNNIPQQNDVVNVQNTSNEVDLGNTIRIEPVQTEIQSINEVPANEPIGESIDLNKPIENTANNNIVSEVTQTMDNQSIDVEQNQITIDGPTVSNEQMAPVEPSMPEMESINVQKEPNRKNKVSKLVWVFLAIALAIIALVLVSLAATKSSNNSISVLEKALANLTEKGENSATVDAKLSMAATTGESFAFSAIVKAEKKNTDLMNMQITVNKSMMFDEMNVYAEISKENATLYAESSLIDMLGMTSSLTPTWVYYTLAFDEIIDEETTNETIQDIELKDIIDSEHFVYVDKVNELNHYELTIDQELVNNIETKLNYQTQDAYLEEDDSIEFLEEPVKVDFYINSSNELVKIEIDMSESLIEEDFSSLVMSMEFSNLGTTYVEIPSDAKNSITDLETYITLNAVDYGYDDSINDEITVDTGLDSNVYVY